MCSLNYVPPDVQHVNQQMFEFVCLYRNGSAGDSYVKPCGK